MTYSDYIRGGARTKPLAVRFDSRHTTIAPDVDPIPTTYVPRATYLKPADFAKHGYSAGCPGCEFLVTGLGGRKNHTPACRLRMEELLANDDAGRERLRIAAERKDLWTSKQLEKGKDSPTIRDGNNGNVDMDMGEQQKPSAAEEMQLEGAEASVRAAVLGKFDERDMLQRSTGEEDGNTELEDTEPRATDIRLGTPDRAPPTKRVGEAEDEDMGTGAKSRRIDKPDIEGMLDSMNCPFDHPGRGCSIPLNGKVGKVEEDAMSEEDRNILKSVILGVDITEVYSPVRVAAVAGKFGLTGGTSFDLTNGWNFSDPQHRAAAWKKIKQEDPYCIIGSPPCTMFSALQELSKAQHKDNAEWMRKHESLIEEAAQHIQFCCALYCYQLRRGKHFLHEHPWSAKSWKLKCVESLMEDSRVSVAYANMCQFGMTTHVDVRQGPRGPVAKPTGFMTSSWTLYNELSKPCRDSTHSHVPLLGGRAANCQVYPPALCEAMCRGIAKQRAWDAGGVVCSGSLGKAQLYSLMTRIVDPKVAEKLRPHCRQRPAARPIGDWPGRYVDHLHEPHGGCDLHGGNVGNGVEVLQQHMDALYQRGGAPEAWDDMNNVFLDPTMVVNARKEEMDFFKKLGVYERVPRDMVTKSGGKII